MQTGIWDPHNELGNPYIIKKSQTAHHTKKNDKTKSTHRKITHIFCFVIFFIKGTLEEMAARRSQHLGYPYILLSAKQTVAPLPNLISK